MTFRPSDDVLEERASDSQQATSLDTQYDNGNQDSGQHFLHSSEEMIGNISLENAGSNNMIENLVGEEVKAPDLSDLLNEGESPINNISTNVENANVENIAETQIAQPASNIENAERPAENTQKNADLNEQKTEEEIEGKLSDEERVNLVSGVEGSIHSKLDFLVDDEWINVIKKYKKLHRIVFKRGVFIIFSVIGVCVGAMMQVKAQQPVNLGIISESSIQRINSRAKETSKSILDSLKDQGVNIDTIVTYGSASINGNSFFSKSNLVSYNGLILPQFAAINYKTDTFSLDDFNNGKMLRSDLENIIQHFITDDSIYIRTKNLPNLDDNTWIGQTVEGSGAGLTEGFSLGCLGENKVSDFVCEKFLDTFYEYGKYYDLSRYADDLLSLVKILQSQHKDIEPICEMVKEYTRRSRSSYSNLDSVMQYCSSDDLDYYKKMVNFMRAETSVSQPELSDAVFDDPDLNAYKLLSAQQSVHKILDGSSLNKNFIISYLQYVQALIDKDGGTSRYLSPIYKDLLYVFNMDVLYEGLLKRSELSSDLKSQIEQINNGNRLLQHTSLLNQLTTPDIVKSGESFTGSAVVERSLEDIFAQFYTMTDKLQIRGVEKTSDTSLRVQTEIFSDDILSVTDGETLKARITLHRKDNILYVDSINVSNQLGFSDILNIYAKSENVTLYAMLAYIDEQIGFWYEKEREDTGIAQSLCDELLGNGDIAVYVCDAESVVVQKGEIEYNFILKDGVLQSFTVSDAELDSLIKDRLKNVMIIRDNTSVIIQSIIDFAVDKVESNDIEKKLQVIDQFRINLKLIPNVYDIEGGDDSTFLVEFALGEFELQAHYNVDTHLLTRISYMACDQTLEIRNLTIEISVNNEAQLTEILNNPRIFLTNANQAAFKKYQRMCDS